MSCCLRKLSWKFTFIILFLGSVFVIFFFELRYFSTADKYLFLEPKPAIVTGLSKSFKCFDKHNDYMLLQKGRFWVLQNYIRANRWFACDQSVTLTTIGDPILLENLKTLVEHWNGPISVALYTPGTDFEMALYLIRYLRICYPMITEFVSFHLFFEIEYKPLDIPSVESARILSLESNLCTIGSPWKMNKTETYRAQKGLKFPINVGRNIARNGATTHFILASDIELFPSQNLVPDFLNLIRQNLHYLEASTPGVFVLPPFEVEENALVPSEKRNLLAMLANGSAVKFHKYFCAYCHTVPGYQIWLKANQNGGLHVIHTSKRKGFWEPFYISTNSVPYFDERVDWEGRCNKLVQAYSMCVLGYDYHLLDNAFLVHKPGIKRGKSEADIARDKFAKQSIQIVRKEIEPDIHALYGINKNCTKISVC